MQTDIWTCALRELSRRKVRTAATVLGYALAAGIAIVALSLLVAARNKQNRVLLNTGTHFMAWTPVSLNCAPQNPALDPVNEGFLANNVPTVLFYASVTNKVVAERNCVKAASPYLLFRFKDPKDGHLFTVGGFDPRDIQVVGNTCCAKADLVAGKFLEPTSSGQVLLEHGYAQGRKLQVGQTATIAGKEFTIAGIVNPGVRPAKADVYMLFQDAEAAINTRLKKPLRNEANVLLVHAASSVVHDKAIEKTLKLLDGAVTESCACYKPGSIVTSYACYKPAAQVLGMNEGTLKLVALILGLGALVFAGKSQMASVIERRRDIGVLKAIGWTNQHITFQVLTESTIQAVIGSAFGCIGAFFCVSVLPKACLFGISLTLIGGLCSGFVPAFRATRQNPADTLRRL